MYYNSTTDPGLNTYFDALRRTHLLTKEDEASLSEKILHGDSSAHRKLVEANLRLVVKIARGYRTNQVSLAELIQEGNIGLLQAASRFDRKKNAKFSTYAGLWIKQAINRYLNGKTRTISIPHRKEETLKRIRFARELLQHDLGRNPSNSETATFLGIPESEITAYQRFEIDTCPLESEDEAASIIRFLPDATYSPERSFLAASLRDETRKFLTKLKKIEQTVIRHRFELDGAQKMTLRELGEYLGISAESVRLVEKKAILKLRTTAGSLVDYLGES